MSEAAILTDIRQRREAIVREHIAVENRQDAKATLATFSDSSAQMDLPAFGDDGQVSGHDAVLALYEELFLAFPDFHVDIQRLRHGDDHVLTESLMSGTQHEDWAGIPNSGGRFVTWVVGVFEFDRDQLLRERGYFDLGDISRQLTAAAPWASAP